MKFTTALVLALSLIFTACNKDENSVREGLGVSTPTTSGGAGGGGGPMDPKILRVVDENNQALENRQLAVGDSLVVRAALYTLNNQFIEYAPASWNLFGSTVMNTNFPASNLVVDPSDSTKATLTPTTIGVASVGVSYAGVDGTVIVRSDRTGNIFVSSTQEVFALSIKSGNSQTGMADTELQDPLEVIARDQYGQGIAGTTLEISISQGNGSIISGVQALTDSTGAASFRVKVGTVAGSGNNIFRVRSVSKPGLSPAYLSASVTPGEVDHLKFTVEPQFAYQSVPFGNQPIVDVMDVFDNKVDVSGTMTITKAQGTGNLLGTTSLPVVSGRATFTNLSWDTYESNVKIQATYGTRSQESVVFSVGQSLPGACLINDSQFRTQDGGCKDQSTNLVWSSVSSNRMNWNDIIWDSQFPGASAPDADDYGRTNDYTEGQVSYFPTTTSSSYCKNLIQGGYSDWRLPTSAELSAAYGRSARDYLRTVMNESYHSSSSQNSWNGAAAVNLSSGATENLHMNNDYRFVFCVRGGNRASTQPSKITIESVPVFSSGGVTSGPLVVQVRNAANGTTNLGGITLTLTASSGSVSSGNTAVTDVTGKASFTGVVLTGSGNLNITVSYNGGGLYSLTPVTQAVNVKNFIQFCTTEDSLFATADGGCKDLATGLVWSAVSPGTMKWNAATWDAAGAGASVPDAGDYGRTNDYGSDCNVGWDGNYCDRPGFTTPMGAAFCKDLVEGGYTDWRLPTTGELAILAPNRTRLQGVSGKYLWSSNKLNSSQSVAGLNGSTGETISIGANGDYSTICVRGNRKLGNVIKVLQKPDILQSGLGPSTSIRIQVTDEDDVPVFAEKTFTITSPTLTIGGTTTFTSNYLGIGESGAFTVTGSMGNHNLVISSPDLLPRTISVRITPFKQYCLVEDGNYQTADGGCKDMTTGLVWSAISNAAMSWHDALWDASVLGAPAADADDLGRTNDYGNNCGNQCDTTTAAYCKSLVESGYSDWRLPTASELGTIASNTNRIPRLQSLSVFSSSYISWDGWVSILVGSSGVIANHHFQAWGGLNVMCVRGNRLPASVIKIIQGPMVMSNNSSEYIPLQIQVQDSNNQDAYSEKTFTITSDTLTLSGTTTFKTNKYGASDLVNSFTVNGSLGNHVLKLDAPGLPTKQISVVIRNGVGAGTCYPETTRFISQNGGCHDTLAGKVWSRISTASLNWNQAIWDSALAGNAPQDVHDNARQHDYHVVPNSPYYDTSTMNYCHELVEGGKEDWRMPTVDEVAYLSVSNGINIIYPRISTNWIWTSTTDQNWWNATAYYFFEGRYENRNRGDQYRVLCVRDE